MDLRTRINDALKDAMRAKAADRLSVLRLMNSAIKDRDIAARGEGQPSPVPDDGVIAVLAKMVKQRQESARAYDEAGRDDLSGKERSEAQVIEEFLPRQLSQEEAEAAVAAAIAETGASSIKDMGRVMAALRSRHAGQMDFSAVGPLVKARLG
ncbi:Transamidase GatB domain protein [Rubellimicrobium mesophilum DSM 19309]|uniref:Transamidase GatB domain protein n=1 Tax=Rubellimicrobium mesophilum DSM 19309 TaxID=442562 RepID=A0A017HUC8_9RHOB|nr:GatB/YqeY domain-containing protein [Rubellimicrobium mesophilum]EYD77768.1 Transamidase GatB domain protein [Rubellimicrobium mesophilum DSM 19309]